MSTINLYWFQEILEGGSLGIDVLKFIIYFYISFILFTKTLLLFSSFFNSYLLFSKIYFYFTFSSSSWNKNHLDELVRFKIQRSLIISTNISMFDSISSRSTYDRVRSTHGQLTPLGLFPCFQTIDVQFRNQNRL